MPDLIIYSIILKHGSNTMKNQKINKKLSNIQRRERKLRRTAVQDLKQEILSYELIKGNLFKNNSYESATSASQLTVAQLYKTVALNLRNHSVLNAKPKENSSANINSLQR